MKGSPQVLRTLRKHPWLWGLAGIVAIVGGLFAIFARRRPPRLSSVLNSLPRTPIPVRMVAGLTDAEAASRRPDVDFGAIAETERRAFRSQAIRKNLFTLFNLDLFVIAVLMFFLGSPWNTVLTLLVLTINVSLNASQEVVVKRRLDALFHTMRPKATVIRGGVLVSVDVTEIVVGDMVVVGRGDEIFVAGFVVGDGELTIDRATTGDGDQEMVKSAGDRLDAHTFCATGRAIYEATEAGAWRVAARRGAGEILTEELTPLRALVRAVLRALFAIVIVISLLVFANALLGQRYLITDRYREIFSLIFGIAPTSLFFILIIDYAVGLLAVARVGGLTYRSTAVEALANVSVLCISLRSILQGTHVTLETIPGSDDRISDQLMRRMLGDMADSTLDRMPTVTALADALPGQRREPFAVAGHFAALGWYGASFRDPDMSGTFVVGEARLLAPHFARAATETPQPTVQTVADDARPAPSGVRGFLRRFTRRTERNAPQESAIHASDVAESSVSSDGETAEHADGNSRVSWWRNRARGLIQRVRPTRRHGAATEDTNPLTPVPQDADRQPDDETDPGRKPSRWRRLIARLRRPRDEPEEPTVGAELPPAEAEQPRALIFAYRPEVVPLTDAQGQPQVPTGLVPLARITLTETIRPEMVSTMRALRRANVAIVLLSHDDSARVRNLVHALGLEVRAACDSRDCDERCTEEVRYLPAATTGTALIGLTADAQAQALREMQARGEFVAMVGESVGDLAAMREAQLRIALRSSSQAALEVADIVLLADSLDALPAILRAGQRIINAVLNTLKLHLSQIGAQTLLLGAVVALQLSHFFYATSQAAVISVCTITIPNIFLRFWAPTGRIGVAAMRPTLACFIIPAMIANGLLALAIHLVFWLPTGMADYAQLVTSYALLGAGWLLLLFVLPPTRFWAAATPQVGDRRIVGLVLALIPLFFALPVIPFSRRWFHIDWLPRATDYLVVGITLCVWTLALRVIWRVVAGDTGDDAQVSVGDTSRPPS